MTKKNAKKISARARQAQLGGNYTHHRQVVEQPFGNHEGSVAADADRDAALLAKLGFKSSFGVVTGRSPTATTSANLEIALEGVRRKVANPTWFARDGHHSMLVSKEESDLLVELGAVGDELKVQVHRSFDPDYKEGFSAQCQNCRSWIFLGDFEHAGACRCGQEYRVVFDGEEDWSRPRGVVCVDCGRNDLETETSEPTLPWKSVHDWQNQCGPCQVKTLSSLQHLERQADVDVYVARLEPGENVWVRRGLDCKLGGEIIERDAFSTTSHHFISRMTDAEVIGHMLIDEDRRARLQGD